MSNIVYRICPRRPETHLLEVECIIPTPDIKGQKLSLPTWIPGSYLIRDFSKYLVDLKAEISQQPVLIRMLTKNTWECGPLDKIRVGQDPLIITYQVYAYDLAPRGAHVDNSHAFFNGSRVFMQVAGFEDKPCELEIINAPDPKYHHWQVATSLPMKNGQAFEFGRYIAENYIDLIDHPVEIGQFEVASFQARGVRHDLVMTNPLKNTDMNRLAQDVKIICEHHIDFFGEPAANHRYLFLLTTYKYGQGGLEHKYSCVAHTSYEEIPKINPKQPEDPKSAKVTSSYRHLLGLLSHEYFHAWHVKRIKPLNFSANDLSKENYTRLLWLFEGITSYYDELALIRTKLITVPTYLEMLTENINRVYSSQGRFKQTLEESSFEAWTKFYKPDENSRNTTVNYYTKGALVGLCLDLRMRLESSGKCSLDDIMRALWLRFGKEEKGIPEEGFESLVKEVSGYDLSGFFDLSLRTTVDLPLEALLKTIGIKIQWKPGTRLEDLGGKISNRETIELLEVQSNSPFEMAGLCARDQLLAINHLKVDRNSMETILSEYQEGDILEIHGFRRDQLLTWQVVMKTGNSKLATLQIDSAATNEQKKSFEAWLGQSWNVALP